MPTSANPEPYLRRSRQVIAEDEMTYKHSYEKWSEIRKVEYNGGLVPQALRVISSLTGATHRRDVTLLDIRTHTTP